MNFFSLLLFFLLHSSFSIPYPLSSPTGSNSTLANLVSYYSGHGPSFFPSPPTFFSSFLQAFVLFCLVKRGTELYWRKTCFLTLCMWYIYSVLKCVPCLYTWENVLVVYTSKFRMWKCNKIIDCDEMLAKCETNMLDFLEQVIFFAWFPFICSSEKTTCSKWCLKRSFPPLRSQAPTIIFLCFLHIHG